jgi:hypothetical protein
MSPTLYPKTGFLGRFGWGGSGFTGSLQNTHAATRMSPKKKLGGFTLAELGFNKFANPQANRHVAILTVL